MIKKNNKMCICCQKKYTFCLNCSDFDHLPRWMAIFHDENCKEIYDTVMSYSYKHLTKEQAKDILNKCDLSGRETFNKKIQEILDEIYIDDSTSNTISEIEVVNEVVVEEIKEISEDLEMTKNDEFVEEEKPIKTKRKCSKNTTIIDNE